MAAQAKYTVVGRYMDGATVMAYHLLDIDGEQRKLTREQVIFLVGKGDISNCKGQLHKNKVLLRGIGININDLPIVDEKTGNMKNTDNLGRIARGATNAQALAQFTIIGKIVQGSKVVGFTVANVGGATRDITRAQAETAAKQMKIGNARIQDYKGRPILRLLNIKMGELPVTSELPVNQKV